MTKPTELIVSFDDNGDPTIEVVNGDGKTCKDLTASIEKALGTVSDRKFKPEFHRQQAIAQNRLAVRK